jgi:predicted nucleic acid-binding protein
MVYFADTFYFLAILSHSDAAHSRAVALAPTDEDSLVTTEWILTEVADALSSSPARGVFVALYDRLRARANVQLVKSEHRLFELGVNLDRDRPDKEWSLTDCISFAVMQELHLTDALTGDHHFEQAGFRALLK